MIRSLTQLACAAPSFGVRNWILHLALAAFLVFAATAPAEAAAPASGRVVKAQDLWINGKTAAVGAVVRQRDRLKTGPRGQADVILADGAIFRLYHSTSATVPLIGRRTRVELLVGRLMSVVGKPMDFQARAPRAGATVGGTTFFMEATKAHPNYVCACDGKVFLGPRGGPRTLVDASTTHHIAAYITPIGFQSKGRIDHQDSEMGELVETLAQVTGLRSHTPPAPAAEPPADPDKDKDTIIRTEPASP